MRVTFSYIIFIILWFPCYIGAQSTLSFNRNNKIIINKALEFMLNESSVDSVNVIESGFLEVYNFQRIVKENRNPDIFTDSIHLQNNIDKLGQLKNFNKNYPISYSLNLIFGTKQTNDKAWLPHFSVVFFDEDFNPIYYTYFAP